MAWPDNGGKTTLHPKEGVDFLLRFHLECYNVMMME